MEVQPGLKSIIRGSLWNFRQTGNRKFFQTAVLFTSSFIRQNYECVENDILTEFFSISKRLDMMNQEMRQKIWRTNEEKKT